MLYLRCIEQAALIAVVVAFAFRGLLKYYPAFALFLVGKGTRSLCLLLVDPHDPLYGKWWALSAPALMVLQLLVFLELTGKIVEHYPRIDKRGAQLIVGSCLAIGAVFGGISSFLQFGSGTCPWYVPAAVGAYKVVDWVSVGGLAFLSVWLGFFPEPIRRNVQWHRWLLATYMGFAPGMALMFSTVGNSEHYLGDMANWGLELTEICCCVLWSFALNQAGEAFPYVPKTVSDEELAAIDHDYQDVFNVLREQFPLPEVMRKD
jgi:hypothetical protein